MLSLLRIKNIALIDELSIEFGAGLNLLTGETGSGKSIIVDSLGALTGERVSSDLIKHGCDAAMIEGLFTVAAKSGLRKELAASGLIDDDDEDLIVRRELSSAGKNRVFINNQLVKQGYLKSIGPYIVDIHGQGEQAALYDTAGHLDLLDRFAGNDAQRVIVADAFSAWSDVRDRLRSLRKDESEKLQLVDLLRFQVDEIETAGPVEGEDIQLEEEKRRLNNVEKLTALSGEALALLYDNDDSTAATLGQAERRITELAQFDARFAEYSEPLAAARAVIEDLAYAVRDLGAKLEFSPERLAEIEERLAELSRLKRKYGGSIESVLEHLSTSRERLDTIDTAELREQELLKLLTTLRSDLLAVAGKLHDARVKAAKKFEKAVEQGLAEVALDKARFEVRFTDDGPQPDETAFSSSGYDRVEFFFSANPGEPPKPLARVASGGEASRLMLVVKTAAGSARSAKAVVFDEIDAGIGGRAAEAVGRKLKALAADQQVLCVTHQPQIASQADRHFLVQKHATSGSTSISVRELDAAERVEEVARMLAGEQITDAARENARAMLRSA
jgi:DNA repair protein RecN (Recombination protein N)